MDTNKGADMAKEVEVELLEGETILDALQRFAGMTDGPTKGEVAKELLLKPKAKPVCGYEGDEVCSPPDCAGACPQNKPDLRPERPRTKKEKSVTVSDPMVGDAERPDVYSALHVYQQPNMSDAQVRSMATRERASHGPATLVFQHMHVYGAPCSVSCKEKVA